MQLRKKLSRAGKKSNNISKTGGLLTFWRSIKYTVDIE
jgi:hypothetical protein